MNTTTGFNMSASYWNRGVYTEEDEGEDYLYFEEKEPETEGLCCAMGCMECLGLSWSDFY